MVLKGHTSQVFSAQFSPNGKQVVTASGDGTARIWTIEPDENPIFKGHTGYVMDANFSPDGEKIVTAAFDYTAKLWGKNGSLERTFVGLTHYAVTEADFSKDGNFIYGSCDGASGMIWKIDDTLKFMLETHGHYHDMEMYDTTKVYWHSDNNVLSVYDLQNNEKGKIKNVSGYKVWNNQIISINTDSTLSFWNQTEGDDTIHFHQTRQLKIKDSGFNAAEVSPNGKYLLTAHEDSVLRLWLIDSIIETKNPQPLFERKINAIIGIVKFAPNSTLFASSSDDNIIRLWNTNGDSLAQMKGHSDAIADFNFSSDCKWIVSGSSDKTVRLWDMKGNEIMNYPGHKNIVNKVKFSPDEQYILSASDDHTARLMPISVGMVLDKINKEKVRGEVWQMGKKEKEVYGVQ